MRKILIISLSLILLGFLAVFFLRHPSALKSNSEKIFQGLKNLKQVFEPPFSKGEKFKFNYAAGPLKTGSAELTFLGNGDYKGKDVYFITFESKVGVFYDLEKIYADPNTFYPVYIKRNLKNFGMATTIEEVYDQESFQVEIIKQSRSKKKTQTIKKTQPIHNAILLLYYCRQLLAKELKPGFKFNVALPSSEFKVILKGVEEIEVPAGIFQAYVFESEPKKIKLWIARNQDHTPLKMENLTAFGPSSIILKEVVPLKTAE